METTKLFAVKKLLRILTTSWNLHPIQIYWRLRAIIIRKGFPLYIQYIRYKSKTLKFKFPKLPNDILISDSSIQNKEIIKSLLHHNKYYVFDYTVNLKKSYRWNNSKFPRLISFNLHYFEFIQELLYGLNDNIDARNWVFDRICSLISSWIDTSVKQNHDAFHPFTISKRLPNWLAFYSYYENDINRNKVFKNKFLNSVMIQYHFLKSNCEFDVGANHLLENACCLTLVEFFSGSVTARTKKLVVAQIQSQILDDGGHIERNPSYHCAILKLIFKIWIISENENWQERSYIKGQVIKASDFIESIVKLDYSLPNIKDCNQVDYNNIPQLINTLRANSPKDYLYSALFKNYGVLTRKNKPHKYFVKDFESSKFLIIKSRKFNIIYDYGNPVLDTCPAHSHADIFNYELEFWKNKIVVDSGVYEYAPGRWRDYFRSTRAHNTCAINCQNMIDTYDSFRVGRRTKPVVISKISNNNINVIEAYHSGYKQFNTYVKRLFCIIDNENIIILDVVVCNDFVEACSRIILHPGITLEAKQRNERLIKGTGFTGLFFKALDNNLLKTSIKPYSSHFGKIQETNCIEIQNSNEISWLLGYTISRHSVIIRSVKQTNRQTKLVFSTCRWKLTLIISKDLQPSQLYME